MNSIIDVLEIQPGNDPIWRFPAEGLELSLSEIYGISARFAEKLQAIGIGKQNKVGMVLGNSSDYVALLFAVWRLNAIAVPLRPKGSPYTQHDKYLFNCDQACDLDLIIYSDTATPELFQGWFDRPGKQALALDEFKSIGTAIELSELSEQPQIEPDDIAVLQFSSGSTGQPKAVIVTHGMVMAQLINLNENHALFRSGKPCSSSSSWLPINHDMGLFIGVLKPIYTRSENLLAPPSYYMRNPGRWFSLLSELKVDLAFSTNSALSATLSAIRRLHKVEGIDLSNLQLYIAAEKISPVILNRCYEVFSPLQLPEHNIHIGYGMAENALGCACTKQGRVKVTRFAIFEDRRLIPSHLALNPQNEITLVSVGSPDSLNKITIRDTHGQILPELSIGEIHITGPCVSPGYFNNPQATHRTFVDGGFKTGDLGFYYQGELYFYARSDDMITIGGRNLIPDDIEVIAEELPFIKPTSTCLTALENQASGTTELALLIEVNPTTDHASLNQYSCTVQRHIFAIMEVLVSRIIFCAKGAIEKTSSGKKRRNVIRERLVNQKLQLIGAENEF